MKAWTHFTVVRVDMVRDDAPAAVRAEAVRRVRETVQGTAVAQPAPSPAVAGSGAR